MSREGLGAVRDELLPGEVRHPPVVVSQECLTWADMSAKIDRITVPKLVGMKKEGQKITMVTAYDHMMAGLLDETGVEAILVGDTLGMVVQGHESTLPVTLEQMIYHGEMVCRAVRRALTIVDLPFPSYHLGRSKAIDAAGRVLKETHCQAVKLEGGADQAEVIEGLVAAGIPVMAHCGLRPQSVHLVGGYKVQRQEEQLLADAQAAEEAGAFAVVLECIPQEIAAKITGAARIPTIGIGAGSSCDGQVLVTNDLLGLTEGPVAKFVKKYASLREVISEAIVTYRDEVRSGDFPAGKQSYK